MIRALTCTTMCVLLEQFDKTLVAMKRKRATGIRAVLQFSEEKTEIV